MEFLAPMIVGCALFMQTLDSTVISTALPAMARSLHEDPITLNLAITSICWPGGLPADQRLGGRPLRRKHVFRIAIVIFALGSVFCGLSSTAGTGGRAHLAGLGGAMMVPVGRLVVLRTMPKSELVPAMSYLTMPAVLGPVVGPPVGGFIVTYYSWRWIFFINVPIAIIGIVAGHQVHPQHQARKSPSRWTCAASS